MSPSSPPSPPSLPSRPDLRVLSDADLAGASNKLTLKRARKDLAREDLRVTFEAEGETLVARWSDEHVCHFPPGGLGASRCSCPARRLCVHRVRSILAWRDASDQAVPDELADWSPSAIPFAELERAPGFAAAVKMLHDGLAADEESPTAIVFGDLGVRVRFVPGQGLEGAICSCREPGVCLHRVAAALLFHPLPPLPDQPDEREVLAKIARAALVLAGGLDGMPREAKEMLDATQQDVVGDGQHEAARDLRRLADLLEAYHDRSARFDGRAWTWALARLAVRVELLERGELPRASLRLLRGEGRTSRMVGKKLELQMLGAEGSAGASGSVVRLHLVQRETGRLYTAAIGRGARGDRRPPSPAFLYRQLPAWGALTAEALATGAFVLHGPRVGADGSLSVGGDTKVHQATAEQPVAEVAAQHVVRSATELVHLWTHQRPPLLREGGTRARLCLLALPPDRVPAPRFDETAQRLRAVVPLIDGGAVRVAVGFRTGAEATLDALEQWPYLAPQPTHLFARVAPGEGAFFAEPISWVFEDGSLVSPGLDPLPETTIHAHPGTLAAEDARGSDSLGRARFDVFDALLDTLEGWVVSGLQRLPEWRRARLAAHAGELGALGLHRGAARVDDALGASDRRERLREVARLVAWCTTAEELARLDALSGG